MYALVIGPILFLRSHLKPVQLQYHLALQITLSHHHSLSSLWWMSCVYANLKLLNVISHEGSLTTIIRHCIRFNNTIREFMPYKYRQYTHTNNIRFSVSCCAINFWLFWRVTIRLFSLTFLCFITMQRGWVSFLTNFAFLSLFAILASWLI